MRRLSTGQGTTAGVRLELAGPVAIVTLGDGTGGNAQTPGMWAALAAISRELTGAVRVIVLRAEGPEFSVGLDRRLLSPEGVPGQPTLAALAGRSDQSLDAALAEFQAAFTWWGRPDLVSIAAVHGHAIGAGFQLALACDLRVLADDAQLAMRETGLGLVPDLGGTGALVAAVGYSRALELCVTGRTVGAAEARDLGLATLVVPRAELAAAVDDLVAAVLAAPRDAVVEIKALLREAGRRTREAQWAAEREAQARRLRDLTDEGE